MTKYYLLHLAVCSALLALCLPAAGLGVTDQSRPNFVLLEPGHFRMGNTPGPGCLKPGHGHHYDGPHWDEAPVHDVRITYPLLMSVTQISNTRFHDFSMIKRVSVDNGATWSKPSIVREYPAVAGSEKAWHGEPRLWPHMDIIALEEDTMLLPTDAYRYGGTAVFASRDQGESWSEWTRFGWQHERFAEPSGQAGWIAGIHAPMVLLKDGRWLAFGRAHDIDGRSPCSISSDQGKTWTYQASPFPPLHSGQRAVLKRLEDGPILYVSFARPKDGLDMTDAKGQSRPVHGMFAALSFDEAKTWPYIKLIPRDSDHPDVADGGGYLSCVQTPDRVIHLLSSRRYWRFNLAWLKQPHPASTTATEDQ